MHGGAPSLRTRRMIEVRYGGFRGGTERIPGHKNALPSFGENLRGFGIRTLGVSHLPTRSGHASVQTSGFSLTLRNRGKGGWARDLRGRRQNCLPRYSAGVKSRSVVLGYPS